MQHIIKKQIINLTLNKKMDAFAIQHLVSERYWREIVPLLQKLFDNASTEDEIIHLDKLEVDLGIINIKDIEKGRWNDEVYKKISEQLKLVNAGQPSEEKVKKQSKTVSSAEQWIFYMRHGYLPWNVLKVTDAWYKNVLEAFAADFIAISKLRYLIRNNRGVAARIFFHHPINFLEALVETLTAEKQATLSQSIDEIAEVIIFLNRFDESDKFQKKQLIQKLWNQVLQLSAIGEENLNPSKFAMHLLKSNSSDNASIHTLPRKFLLKNRLTASILKQIKKSEVGIEKIMQADESGGGDTIQIETKNRINEDGIFIQNAGLILLHPFLNMFFKNLQLVKENDFEDALSHQKALHLLHYLATGLLTSLEHELVIEKILCAYPLENPVDNKIELTADELNEADTLLVEVILQWEILKGTSVAGLRESFLQRNGKLSTKNNDLHLQVESGAIDVLLDHLPWNLSMIKLPWMNDILRVEWR